MRFTIHHHHEFDPRTQAAIEALTVAVQVNNHLMGVFMTKTTDAIASLRTDIQGQSTIIASAKVAFDGLAAQIAALKTADTDAATAAAIDELHSEVTANSAALAADIPANTGTVGDSQQPAPPPAQPPADQGTAGQP